MICEHCGDAFSKPKVMVSYHSEEGQSGAVSGRGSQLIVGNRQELKQKVSRRSRKASRKFVIDFSKDGVHRLFGGSAAWSRCPSNASQGGELRLAGLNADLQTLFELTKLDTLFAITPDGRGGARRVLSLRLDVTSISMRPTSERSWGWWATRSS